MLIVKVQVSSQAVLKEAIAIARGDVVSVRPDTARTGGFLGQLVLREEAQLEKLRAIGVELKVVFDSRTAPDPREEVGKGDRFAEQLERLKREKGKA